MACVEALRVQAYFDGELDANASLEVERHVATCSECGVLLQDLQTVRDDIRGQASYHHASLALNARVAAALDRESPGSSRILTFVPRGRKFWSGAVSGAAISALAAVLAVSVFLPGSSDPLIDDLMSAHQRSLIEGHLIDVVSSDQHTVKPWFAGHADVSPPANDFPKEDYRLVGGRADYVDGRRAAVVVYRHGAHIINVFAWNAREESLPNIVTRQGYHVACWRDGALAYCAVSDTGLDELATLTRLVQATATPETRE